MIVPRAPARGFQKAANAASALSRGREPMESSALELSRVGGGSNLPLYSISDKPRRARHSLYPDGSSKGRCNILKTNTFPVVVPLPGWKCGLQSQPGCNAGHGLNAEGDVLIQLHPQFGGAGQDVFPADGTGKGLVLQLFPD